MYQTFLCFLCVSFLLCNSGCKSDPKQPDVDQAQLIGRWEIETGFRNGKKTETLTGTFFEFSPEGKMKTNLTPTVTEEEYEYSVDGNIINQEGDPAVAYTIDSLTASQLNLSMTINNFPFKVWLKKAEPAEMGEEPDGIMQ